jgi:hypothetical protein
MFTICSNILGYFEMSSLIQKYGHAAARALGLKRRIDAKCPNENKRAGPYRI